MITLITGYVERKIHCKNKRNSMQCTVKSKMKAVDRGDHSDKRVSTVERADLGKYTVKYNRI